MQRRLRVTMRLVGEADYAADEPVGMNEWLTNAAHTLNVKPPFSVPLWLLRLLMPYMAVIFETRLPVSDRKAKDELRWQLAA